MDCYSCYKANDGDPAKFDHNGYKIAVIVTPNYCSRCHEAEVKQFQKSHHAAAAKFIGSLDNMLGEIVERGPAANNGCRQCTGGEVKYLGDGRFDPATWPNSGIGRVDPEAKADAPTAMGATRSAQRRRACRTIAGSDYSAAPTCATCHMSATPNQAVTHDVGDRVSITMRPVISTKLENWERRRISMMDVCSNCHASGWIDNFYKRYESTVDLYNEKFAKPAKSITWRNSTPGRS